MNTHVKVYEPKPRITIILLSILIISSSFLVDFILSRVLTMERNNALIIYLQSSLFKQESEMLINFIKWSKALSHIFVMFLAIIFVYNFYNIYKSSLLFFLIAICYFFSSIIKSIYHAERPYSHKQITSYYCGLGWGWPSTQLMIYVPFYLALYKIICLSHVKTISKIAKYSLLCFIIIWLLIVSFGKLLEGSHYLNQVIFSFIFGIGIYVLIFYGFNINLADGKQFYNLIKYKMWIYFVIHIFLLCIVWIPYIKDRFYVASDIKNKIEKCEGKLDGNFYLSQSLNEYDKLASGAFLLISFTISNWSCIIGIKFELHFWFKDNTANWQQFNFSQVGEIEGEENQSLMRSISITRETKWNSTNWVKSWLRLLILLICSIALSSGYIFVSWSSDFFLVFTVKLVLPVSLVVFFIFYPYKVIMCKTSLINGTLITMIHDI